MKAIILAAGRGTRLRPLTNDRPKCMVEMLGKPLLQHQVEVLQAAGISDIHVVGGYLADRLDVPGIHLHLNPDFATTNMVRTLFHARDILDGTEDVVIGYGDIVYRLEVLQSLLDCSGPLCLTADRAWHKYWGARMDDPLADAETFVMNAAGHVTELGNKPSSYDEVQAQYMGLYKIRADHVLAFTAAWDTLNGAGDLTASALDNLYMTSFLQHLIDTGWPVQAVLVDNGWLEVDAPEDLELADAGFWSPLC